MLPRLCALIVCGSLACAAAPPCVKCASPSFASAITRIPANGTRRILVLGSSTAEGAGASDADHSWVGLMSAALAERGFTVINKSVSGTATKDSLSRFTQDVVPYRPDFVVLATSLWNEGFASDPVNVRTTYMNNTRRLVSLVDGIGAVPILIGIYPNVASTPRAVDIIRAIYAEFETMGVSVWDFWNGIADGQGNWLPGLSSDGTHPLNAGHRDLFDTVPISYFEAAYRPAAVPNAVSGSWIYSPSDDGAGQVSVQAAQPPGSWSAAVWFRAGPIVSPQIILKIGDMAPLQFLRTPGGYELDGNGTPLLVTSAPVEPQPVWRHVLLTYSKERKLLSIYLDGALLASQEGVDAAGPTRFAIGGGPGPSSFAHFLVYRAPASPEDAMTLAGLTILRRSIESWIPLSAGHPAGIVNAAGTSTSAIASGNWLFDPSSNVENCLYSRRSPPAGATGCEPGPVRGIPRPRL